jgi:hypothetical protein
MVAPPDNEDGRASWVASAWQLSDQPPDVGLRRIGWGYLLLAGRATMIQVMPATLRMNAGKADAVW